MRPPDLEDQIQQLLDGYLSEEEEQPLVERLKTDEACLELYCQCAVLDSGFTLVTHGPLARAEEDNIAALAEKRPRFRSAKLTWPAAAAILTISLITLKVILVKDHPPILTLRSATDAVFEITHQSDGNKNPDPGSLGISFRLQIAQGTMELTFASEVELIVQAPVDLTVHADDHIYLNEGTAWFRVPSEARGFQVGGFDSSGYVDIDQTQTWSPGNSAFAMSYWFRIFDDGTTLARGNFGFGSKGGDGPQLLYIGGRGNLAFRIDGSSSGEAALVPVSEDDLWHLVIANYPPSVGIELHLDGAGVDTSTSITNFGSVIFDPDQYLGAFHVNGTNPDRGLNGLLDDVAIYEGTLSAAEINGLFTGALSPTQIPEPGSLSLFASRRHLIPSAAALNAPCPLIVEPATAPQSCPQPRKR